MSQRAYTARFYDVIAGWDPPTGTLYLVVEDTRIDDNDDDRTIYSNLNDPNFRDDTRYILQVLDQLQIPVPPDLAQDLEDDRLHQRRTRHMYPPIP